MGQIFHRSAPTAILMANDPLVFIWEHYGHWGFLAYIAAREVWPWVRDRVWPAQVKKARQDQERINRLEERQIEAIESMGKSVVDMTLAISTNNERLSTLIAGFAVHSTEMNGAIALMRERTGYEERRKSRPA